MTLSRQGVFRPIGQILAHDVLPALQGARRLPLRVSCLGSISPDDAEAPRGHCLVLGEVSCPEAASGATISVDDVVLGEALPRDRLGRDLPDWQGCRLLQDGEIFLMNREVRDSLDGRYFGPLPADAIIGMARPIWVASDAAERRDGRFIHP